MKYVRLKAALGLTFLAVLGSLAANRARTTSPP
jgi:hypothetical protein